MASCQNSQISNQTIFGVHCNLKLMELRPNLLWSRKAQREEYDWNTEITHCGVTEKWATPAVEEVHGNESILDRLALVLPVSSAKQRQKGRDSR